MPRSLPRRTHLLLWVLIAVAGGVAGWWQAARTGEATRRALQVDAQRCAVAFALAELGSLAGTPADLANSAYLSIKSRLARLRQVNPGLRSVCIVRYTPATGSAILLADAESPGSKRIANPGDPYEAAAVQPGLRTILGEG